MAYLSRICILVLASFCTIVSSVQQKTFSWEGEEYVLETHNDLVGVGFHLSSSSGAVALSYPNGTTFTLEEYDAPLEYREMMFRLSQDENLPYSAMKNDAKAYYEDLVRRIKRSLRKLLFLNASPEVAIIARVLRELKVIAERRHGAPITDALVSTMTIAGLYQRDLDDALRSIRIRSIDLAGWGRVQPIFESLMPSVLFGFTNVDDSDFDGADEDILPVNKLVEECMPVVSYTREALSVSYVVPLARFGLWQNWPLYTVDWTLGSSHRNFTPYFWHRIYHKIRDHVYFARTFGLPLPSRVFFMGQSADMEDFSQFVEDSRQKFAADIWRGFSPGWHLPSPSAFTGARGAAKLAQRTLLLAETCKGREEECDKEASRIKQEAVA